DGVAGEQYPLSLAQQTRTAGRVAGRVERPQRARSEYELLFVAVSFDVFDGVGEAPDQLVARRHALQLFVRRARTFEQFLIDPRLTLMRDVLKLPFVDIDARARFALQCSGQPAMVFVRVRENYALDVFGLESEFAQLFAQCGDGLISLRPRVDEGDRVVNDQVNVDRANRKGGRNNQFFDAHEIVVQSCRKIRLRVCPIYQAASLKTR